MRFFSYLVTKHGQGYFWSLNYLFVQYEVILDKMSSSCNKGFSLQIFVLFFCICVSEGYFYSFLTFCLVLILVSMVVIGSYIWTLNHPLVVLFREVVIPLGSSVLLKEVCHGVGFDSWQPCPTSCSFCFLCADKMWSAASFHASPSITLLGILALWSHKPK